MIRRAALALIATALAGCGDESGALVDVTQAETITESVDVLHLFVGVNTGDAFRGEARDGDIIFLGQPLAEHTYTIRLVKSEEMADDTPVRLVVVGKHGEDAIGMGVLDLPRLPSDAMLRYALELQPIDQVTTTDTGCVFGSEGVLVQGKDDGDCDGYTPDDGDCDDSDPGVNPGAYDACEGDSLGVDDDCNGTEDDGDLDADDATCLRDCDDGDAARSPDADEDCDGGVDNDCDDAIDEGVPERCMNGVDDDCDPNTRDDGLDDEICADGADNDCDNEVDEGRLGDGGVLDPDVDGDGASCEVDCDDDNEDVFPGATEVCNQTDDNCDGAQDEGVNEDGDPALCAMDCNDENPNQYPGNAEVCDTVDNDCVAGTHPAPSPCFDYTDTPCEYGFRTCNETLGFYGALCEPMLTNPVVVDNACGQFMSCATEDSDRLVCGGAPSNDCVLMVMPSNAVCAGARRPMVAGGDPTTCLWQIIGGRAQQGWTVGLIPEGSTVPVAQSTSCNVDFEVQSVPPGLQPGTFAVALTVDGGYVRTEVFSIAPQRNAVCAVPSLSCVTSL